MGNLVRQNLDGVFDDLFRGFFVRPMNLPNEPQLQMKVDVREDERAYLLHVDLPGVKKEDIQVHVEGNQLSISAEVKQERNDKDGEKLIRSERYFGTLSRSFQFPADLDDNEAQARFENGVLELRLPKRVSLPPRRALTIS